MSEGKHSHQFARLCSLLRTLVPCLVKTMNTGQSPNMPGEDQSACTLAGFSESPLSMHLTLFHVLSSDRSGPLTLQHLKQIWSRRLFKHINKNLKLLKTLRYICHIILKTLLPKEILLSLSNISFGHNVFKSRLLQWRLYASLGDEELNAHHFPMKFSRYDLWAAIKVYMDLKDYPFYTKQKNSIFPLSAAWQIE